MLTMLRKLFPKYVRGKWESQMNFVVSLVGATVGLGDVLRFPVFVVKQKDSSFLIPYFITMFIIGIPLVSMELFLGQFTSTGPATCWEFSPFFKGVGVSSVVLATLSNIFYQVYLAWSLFYVVKSLHLHLPWKTCNREWASDYCFDFLNVTSSYICRKRGWTIGDDGACYNSSLPPQKIKALWNSTLAYNHNIQRKLPALDYLTNSVLGIGKEGISLFNLGKIHWDMFGCIFVVWLVNGLALFWGLRSLVKVLYGAIIYTVIALGMQLVRAVTLDGAADGLSFYFGINIESMFHTKVWLDAANQVFFTLSVNTGVLLCMASFNTFRGDCCMYAFVIAFSNALVSILSGCIIFAVLGSVSKRLHVPLSELEGGGNNLGFVIFPHALAESPWGPLWSALFFLMIFIVGVSSSMVYVQTVLTSALDLYPMLRQHKHLFLGTLCAVYFLLELPLVTDGGFYIIQILEQGIFSFNLFVLAFLQCISLAWVYGANRYLEDINQMVGHTVCGCIPWDIVKPCLCLSWTIICPLFLLYNIVEAFSKVVSKATTIEGALKLTISCIILAPTPVYIVYGLVSKKGNFLASVRSLIKPTDIWGPVLLKDRNLWIAAHNARSGILAPESTPGPRPIKGQQNMDVLDRTLPAEGEAHPADSAPTDAGVVDYSTLSIPIPPIPFTAFSADIFAQMSRSKLPASSPTENIASDTVDTVNLPEMTDQHSLDTEAGLETLPVPEDTRLAGARSFTDSNRYSLDASASQSWNPVNKVSLPRQMIKDFAKLVFPTKSNTNSHSH